MFQYYFCYLMYNNVMKILLVSFTLVAMDTIIKTSTQGSIKCFLYLTIDSVVHLKLRTSLVNSCRYKAVGRGKLYVLSMELKTQYVLVILMNNENQSTSHIFVYIYNFFFCIFSKLSRVWYTICSSNSEKSIHKIILHHI